VFILGWRKSPSEATHYHQDLLRLRPEESKSSSNSSREFSLPTVTPAMIPLHLSGNRNSRVREFSAHNIGSFTSPKPDGQRVNVFFLIGDFPIGKSAKSGVALHLRHKNPNPELRYSDTCTSLNLVVPHCHVTSFSRAIGNRVITISPAEIPCTMKPRMPNPTLPGSRATCPVENQQLRLIRETATRDFMSMKLLPSQTPICRYAMALDSFLHLWVNFPTTSP
jgi:hypothetical protein